jgi:hypothetical protein
MDTNVHEIWLPVNGYEGIYSVSNLGRVMNSKTRRILKPAKLSHGYCNVSLRKNNKTKHFRVHRLVAMAFLPNPFSKESINHKDFNKENNSLSNLEWCTQKDNVRYSMHSGRFKNGRNAKMTLHLFTGIFFNNLREACIAYHRNYQNESKRLNGAKGLKKSQFAYV